MTSQPPIHEDQTAELAALRRRIGELETRLQAQAQSTLEHPLEMLALAIASVTGPRFFDLLVENLTHALDCDAAMVGVLTDDGKSIQPLAYFHHGRLQETVVYALSDTPCENVVEKDFCYFSDGVSRLFPKDEFLVARKVHAYAGIPLLDSNGNVFGLLCVLGSGSLPSREVVEATLRLTASRAAAEIERIRAEQSLRQSEEQLRRQLAEVSAIYRSVPIGLAFINRQLQFVAVNDKLAAINQLSIEAHAGLTVREVVPHLADEVEPWLIQVLETGEPVFDCEVRGPMNLDGTEERIRSRTFFPVKDATGAVFGVSTVVHDITEQKRMEQSLRNSEEQLRNQYAELSTIYRTAPIGLAFLDAELRYRTISDHMAEINGRPIADHIGRTHREMCPTVAGNEEPRMREVLASGVPVLDEEVQAEMPSLPGQLRSFRRSLIPVKDAAGQVLGINVVVKEITQQKLDEAELLIQKHAMLSASGGIILADMKGQITWVNPAYERLVGYNRAEVIGTDGTFLTSEPEKIGEVLQSLAERGWWSGEFRTRHKNGQLFDMLVHASIVRDSTGEPVSTMCWCEDITQQKRIAAERETLIQQLEAKNAELERFTYTVSHDLKSPLVTINGFVGMLEHDLASGNQAAVREDLTEISTAALRMKRLLDELLQLSRIGRVMNPPHEVALRPLAQQAMHALAGTLTQDAIRVEIADYLPIVFGDGVRLLEVLQNLLDNAVKFSRGRPQPCVEIGCREDADRLVVFVRDNGLGIEPQYLKRIFGLFEQLDPAMGGTGIGLAIAKRIVEVHGGTIWAESEGLGKGTTICFILPVPPALGSSHS